MNSVPKWGIFLAMNGAFICGFLHLFFPHIDFARLHIFFFNLTAGQSVILYYSLGQSQLPFRVLGFYLLAILFTFAAFFHWYLLAICLSLVLAGIVENIRCQVFSFIPTFFRREVSVGKKFHQASLLCMSIALVVAAFAIINQEYYRFLPLNKLTLNSFFLGFSFPVSLITFSVAFEMMAADRWPWAERGKNFCFWSVNLGVIIFFLFILWEAQFWQLLISTYLFGVVVVVFFLYVFLTRQQQPKQFITSGICFLAMTAITGILYVMSYYFPESNPSMVKEERILLMQYHVLLSLYGWNLNGLAVILRYRDFPIAFHSVGLISLHWLLVLVLAPLGHYVLLFAVLATGVYGYFLYKLLFSFKRAFLPVETSGMWSEQQHSS